jgi:hypothetical protein
MGVALPQPADGAEEGTGSSKVKRFTQPHVEQIAF